MQPTPCVREMPSSLAGSWWKFPAINVRVSAVKGCVLPESPLLWWFKAEESIANRQRGPLSIMFHRSFNRSSHVWSKFHSILFICLFIVIFFWVLLVPSTTPRSSSLGMSLKTFQAHLRSSLEASSCSKQIWPRAVILSSESQWMSMDVNGCQWMSMDVNGCQWMSMDVNGCQWYFWCGNWFIWFLFACTLRGSSQLLPPKKWGQDRGLSDAVRALGGELGCFSGWLLSANLQDFWV